MRDGGVHVGRFAPSPTGPLHAGSLVAALGSWLRARSLGGRWLLRVEDIDPPREVAGAARAQLDALAAFGLRHDGEVTWQSARHAAYDAALSALLANDRAYPCRCSRSDLAPFGGRHPDACVASDPLRPPALRLRVPPGEVAFDDAVQGRMAQDVAADVGDFVIRRADGLYAYQLAVVVDDAAQGITEVVRGADLLHSTPRQIVLQRALGLSIPAYAHLPLVLDAQGRKLSKSDAAHPIDPLDPPPALRAALAFLGQPVPPADDVDTLLARAVDGFDLARVPRGKLPAVQQDAS